MNTIKLSSISLFAAALIFGSAAYAKAETPVQMDGMIQSHSSTNTGGTTQIDAKTKISIQATIKTENAKCLALKTEDEKKVCFDKLETLLKAKFPNIKDSGIFRDIFRMERAHQGEDSMMKEKDDKNEDEQAKNRVENLSARFDFIIKGFTAIHDRLSTLSDRIESRMKKLSSENVDVSVSTKFVASAREELRLAKISTEAAQISFKAEFAAATNITPDTLKTLFAKTYANLKDAKDHFKNAHHNLVQAVSNLKPGTDKKVEGSVNVDLKTKVN